MTDVLITIDTELSALLHQRGADAAANIASSIAGRTPAGAFGIGWQMDRMDAHGLKGVFFVDPLPALVLGEAIVAEIVGPIVARGHDVQLHIHTEWLHWARQSPVGDRQGRDIADFSRADQIVLLDLARGLLERAGAPRITGFRAGNYGANDDTLAALAELGLTWDSSVNPAYLGSACRITLDPGRSAPIERGGVIELPISGIEDRPGHFRPAQVCALSTWEMRAALRHAATQGDALFTIVCHSFEMLSRDRRRPNRAVMARFDSLCRTIAADRRLRAVRFAELDRARLLTADQPRLGPARARTAARMAAQLLATWRYERRLRPA